MRVRGSSVLLAGAMLLAGCAQVDSAVDQERRLRELAGTVADQDVKGSLLAMADSYLEVQKERFDDLTVVANWAKRNAVRVDALRSACT